MVEKRLAAFGGLLLLDFVISVVMLVTDKNLQTDFGASSPYYLHWYGVLAMGILDLLLGLVLLTFSATSSLARRWPKLRRLAVLGSTAWSVLAIIAMVGIVETYPQVGFANANQFAMYLFGTTAYPGALSYIPWLYDLLLAAYVLTAILGVVSLLRRRPASTSSSASA
jgi:hypothetical protein